MNSTTNQQALGVPIGKLAEKIQSKQLKAPNQTSHYNKKHSDQKQGRQKRTKPSTHKTRKTPLTPKTKHQTSNIYPKLVRQQMRSGR